MEKIDGIPTARLSLIVKAEFVPIFFQLLGQGFTVNIQTGNSVKELLCNQLGIHEDYLAERIQTIFLNSRVVDNINSTNVTQGSVIALSGAMPGLVGAILRRGGYYAGMRSQISHEGNRPASQLRKGNITLKLWNLVVKELGPTFLQQGIWLGAEECKSFIERHSEELKTGCVAIELKGQPVEVDGLQKSDWKTKLVFLQVNSEKTG